MAYTKTVWQSGDIISAAKLNNIENEVETLSAAGNIRYDTTQTLTDTQGVQARENAGAVESFGNYHMLKDLTLPGRIQGVTQFPGNIVVPSECVDGRYISDIGTAPDTAYFHTGYMPVTAGVTYRANHNKRGAWYSDTTAASRVAGISVGALQNGLVAPDGAAYMRISALKEDIQTPFDLYVAPADVYDNTINMNGMTDTTLTKAGGIADAKTVGDRLAEIDAALIELAGLIAGE